MTTGTSLVPTPRTPGASLPLPGAPPSLPGPNERSLDSWASLAGAETMQQSGACRGSPRWPSDTPVAPHLLRDLSSRGSGSRRRPESRSRSRSRRRSRRRCRRRSRRRRQLRRSRRRLEALFRCKRPPNYRFVGGANRPTPPAPDSANVYFRGSRGWPVAGCRRARDLSPDRVASFLALLG